VNTHPHKPARVLIVDDVSSVRQQLSLLLWLSGDIAVVGIASDGPQAVRMAEALHPDVILMDLELPRMDGCEAAQRIKALVPECRVIALTIHDSPETREKCALAGMDAFISKSANVEALLQAIRQSGEPEIQKGDQK
jgi:pilus assembly protein CpaE